MIEYSVTVRWSSYQCTVTGEGSFVDVERAAWRMLCAVTDGP